MSAPAPARLLYVADPLCSWCYGFGPELARLLERHPAIPVDLLMGGLRAGNREPMSEAFRMMLRGHWQHVHEASGRPFSDAIFQRPGFVYDTEPPCRAIVTARTLDPRHAFALLEDLQEAFYRDGVDVTQPEALGHAAARHGYDRAAFLAALDSDAMREATRGDFDRARALGVNGFPTLAAQFGDQLYLVASGFTATDVIEERLALIGRRLAGAGEGAAPNAA